MVLDSMDIPIHLPMEMNSHIIILQIIIPMAFMHTIKEASKSITITINLQAIILPIPFIFTIVHMAHR